MCRSRRHGKVRPARTEVLQALDYLMAMYNAVHTSDRRKTEPGHWINEAFVVRLWAVLEAHHVVDGNKRIDHNLEGWEEVQLCRRLRHAIAHQTGQVKDQDTRILDRRLREHFGVPEDQLTFDGKFTLPKDLILRPMFHACRRYCIALLNKEAGPEPPAVPSRLSDA